MVKVPPHITTIVMAGGTTVTPLMNSVYGAAASVSMGVGAGKIATSEDKNAKIW